MTGDVVQETSVEMIDLGGGISLTALTDAEGSFTGYRDAFPTTGSELEGHGRRRYGELFRGADWFLPFRAFLVRTPDATILIDAGVGPPPSAFLPTCQGALPALLAAQGVSVPDVDIVVLTHLHVDHVGWAAHAGRPFFPKARYIASDVDWRLCAARPASPAFRMKLAPLESADVLERVPLGETRPAPHVAVFPTPGHTPGHLSVRVTGAHSDAIALGDAAVHPLQLAEPDLAYIHEVDRALAASTRRGLLSRFADEQILVAAGHFAEAFGRIEREDATGYRWIPTLRA